MTSNQTEEYYERKLKGYLALSEDKLIQKRGEVLNLIGESNEFYPYNAFNELQLAVIARIDSSANQSPAFAGLVNLILGEQQ
ncbi:MAG: hypothetical protein AABX48_03635 [Nanoarchaeota archaeon]